jgi:thioredoxin-like negative regulator of GroEL
MPLIKVNSVIKGGKLEEKINNNAIVVYHWNNCGHCRDFMPLLYETLERNKQLNHNSNVFEIEYSNFNYIPNYLRNVSAFPYIVAYKKGSIIEEFNDQRTIPKIEAFISRNSQLSTNNSNSISRESRKKRTLKKYNTESKSN